MSVENTEAPNPPTSDHGRRCFPLQVHSEMRKHWIPLKPQMHILRKSPLDRWSEDVEKTALSCCGGHVLRRSCDGGGDASMKVISLMGVKLLIHLNPTTYRCERAARCEAEGSTETGGGS